VKIRNFSLVLFSSFLIISIILAPLANAQSAKIAEDSTKKILTYKLWFVTSNEKGCTINNQKALRFYEKVTDQYLTKYSMPHKSEDSKCVRFADVQKDSEKFTEALRKVDLPIVVLDALTGIDKLLIEKNAWGHYSFRENERIIVFCACSPFVESDNSAWILSHELSHFVLHYQGKPMNIVGDWVHDVQAKYVDCMSKYDLAKVYADKKPCPDLAITVKSPSGKDVRVMKIYAEQSSSTKQIKTLGYDDCKSLSNNKKYNNAIECYRNILEKMSVGDPNYKNAIIDIAHNYHKIKDYKNSITHYEKRLNLDPNDFYTLTSLCYVNYDAGNFNKAMQYGKQALQIRPDDISADICFTYSSSKSK